MRQGVTVTARVRFYYPNFFLNRLFITTSTLYLLDGYVYENNVGEMIVPYTKQIALIEKIINFASSTLQLTYFNSHHNRNYRRQDLDFLKRK